MLLLIDNFDSFTYNLVHAFQQLGQKVEVVRNHLVSVEECIALNPDYIVIGPGPGNPSGAGISKKCIQAASAANIPLFGVCLGHQAIGEVYGGKTVRALSPMHGKLSPIFHDHQGVFQGMPQGFQAVRYHSLVIAKEHFPSHLTITAETSQGEIMGVRHRALPIEGVQFHPESIATREGQMILNNFLCFYRK